MDESLTITDTNSFMEILRKKHAEGMSDKDRAEYHADLDKGLLRLSWGVHQAVEDVYKEVNDKKEADSVRNDEVHS